MNNPEERSRGDKPMLEDRFSVRYQQREDLPEWLATSLPESVQHLPVDCRGEFSPRDYLFASGALVLVAIVCVWFVFVHDWFGAAPNESGGSYPEALGQASDIFLRLGAVFLMSIGAFMMWIAACFFWAAVRLVASARSPIALADARRLADVLDAMAMAGIPVSPVVRRRIAMINDCSDLCERDLRWIARAIDDDLESHRAIIYDRARRKHENGAPGEAEAVAARLRSLVERQKSATGDSDGS